MRDLLPEWIKSYEDFQRMSLELSAVIDQLIENRGLNTHIEETRDFLSDRYDALQFKINEMKAAMANGSKVLLMSEEERAGWDARVKAEELEKTRLANVD